MKKHDPLILAVCALTVIAHVAWLAGCCGYLPRDRHVDYRDGQKRDGVFRLPSHQQPTPARRPMEREA